ncbi:MAG TPA: flagellar hook-length control protein FliK [Polyangiaceae bacterium]|nr:flagellar hook-length control protein FliK [Polyangiaceae bacterium]
MAGVQPATQGQSAAAGAALGDSTDGVSLTSGSSVQSLVANLTKGVADELTAPVASTDDAKRDAAANTAPTADNSASAANAFQAHMGVSSHFQTATDPGNKIGSQVGTAAFNDEVGGKITWMANQGVQSASLQLTPDHLGPIDVRISVQDGSASVAFNAAHADTRAALEQALPRLREMFATQGMSLSDASVSQQSPRGQSQKQSVAAIGAVSGVSDDSTTTTSIAAVSGARPGLVDLYA